MRRKLGFLAAITKGAGDMCSTKSGLRSEDWCDLIKWVFLKLTGTILSITPRTSMADYHIPLMGIKIMKQSGRNSNFVYGVFFFCNLVKVIVYLWFMEIWMHVWISQFLPLLYEGSTGKDRVVDKTESLQTSLLAARFSC